MPGLIPQQFIDDLLDRVDIIDVIDKRVTLKKMGRNYKACCPFHNEKTPSFNVNSDKQFYHCFGCGAGGNAIGFIMDYESIDFPGAVEVLASSVGLEVPREQSETSGKLHKQQQRKKQSIYDALLFASHFYQLQLRQHAKKDLAINYLKKRGLSGEIARDFAIGFAPAGWDNLLKEAQANNQDQQQVNQLEAAGMLVKKDQGGYYDRFRERIIFPIRDNRGRVIAFGGRVLGSDTPKYLNSPETSAFHKQRELYGLYESRKANPHLEFLLMVEGYMDVVSLFQFGISNAVATLGTASSSFHLEKIFRHCNKLVVCFDGDQAGHKAAERLMETALPVMHDGREICFLFLPEGEDPDTFVRQHGKEHFLQIASQAKPLETFLFELSGQGMSLDSEASKARFSQQTLPLITQLPNGIFKQRMLTRLSEIVGVSTDILLEQISRQAANKKTSAQSKTNNASKPTANNIAGNQENNPEANDNFQTKRSAQDQSEQALGLTRTPIIWAISVLLHYPEFALTTDLPAKILAKESLEAKLLTELHSYILSSSSGQPQTTPKLLGHWHGTKQGQILTRCAAKHSPPEEKAIALNEFKDTLNKISKEANSHKIQKLMDNVATRAPSELTAEEKQALLKIGAEKKTEE